MTPSEVVALALFVFTLLSMVSKPILMAISGAVSLTRLSDERKARVYDFTEAWDRGSADSILALVLGVLFLFAAALTAYPLGNVLKVLGAVLGILALLVAFFFLLYVGEEQVDKRRHQKPSIDED